MANHAQTQLSAPVTGASVRNLSVEDFYNHFNLVTCDFVEFSFTEMKNIFFLQGMEEWRSVLKESDRNLADSSIALVSFKPTQETEEDGMRLVSHHRRLVADQNVRKLFLSCFDVADHGHIDASMKTFPTMGIFLSLKKKATRKTKKEKLASKDASIFDDSNSKQVHCLCAVNYFRHEQQTVVLWLATTIDKPFQQSIHTIWRNMGLATYLLCMLIKQHTGAGPNMDKSMLCLQSSNEINNDACRFYKRLGFCEHIVGDNGLSRTSDAFRLVVKDNPQCWVSTKEQPMHFLNSDTVN
jgi:hypothetical protein